jgi:hypothetical protein
MIECLSHSYSVLVANVFLFSSIYFDVSGYKMKLQGFISLSVYFLTCGKSELTMFFDKKVHKICARGGHSDYISLGGAKYLWILIMESLHVTLLAPRILRGTS